MYWPPVLQSCTERIRCGTQRAAKTVVKLRRGRPALLTEPGPNPANENSAVVVDFQARYWKKLSETHDVLNLV